MLLLDKLNSYATILLSYKSRIELKYNFCLVPMTLNSVTSVNHFSFGELALNSLLSIFSPTCSGLIFI